MIIMIKDIVVLINNKLLNIIASYLQKKVSVYYYENAFSLSP